MNEDEHKAAQITARLGNYLGGGVFVKRRQPSSLKPHDELMDVVRCPTLGENWLYELEAGTMTDAAILIAMDFYSVGLNQGIQRGRLQKLNDIRIVLHLPPI